MRDTRADCRLTANTLTLVLLLGTTALAAPAAEPWAYLLHNSAPAEGGYEYRDHFANLRVVLALIRNGCEVEWIESLTSQHADVRRGDFLVPMAQPQARLARAILNASPHVAATRIDGPVSFDSYSLNYPRIRVDAQSWASNYYWYYDTLLAGGFAFEHILDFKRDRLSADDCNLYVVPGGGGDIPAEYNAVLRRFVSEGGNYLGSCWGCAQALYPSEVSYGTGNGAGIADAYNNEITRSFGALGGVGQVVLSNNAPDHPIMWDLPQTIHNIYWNGPVMQPGKNAQSLASLARVVESDFRFRSKDPDERVLDVKEEIGKCLYLVSQRPGEGRVALFGNHPEASEGVSPFTSHAMGHKATFNAILFLTSSGPTRKSLAMPPQLRSTSEARRPARDAISTSPVQEKARKLELKVVNMLTGGSRDWSEDDRSGFYLLRLRDSLQQISAGQLRDSALTPMLNSRVGRWQAATLRDLARLSEQLAGIDPEEMDHWSRSTDWHPLVCNIYERAIELSHLVDDQQFSAMASLSE